MYNYISKFLKEQSFTDHIFLECADIICEQFFVPFITNKGPTYFKKSYLLN